MAAGMTELLSSLPENSEYRPRILHDYCTMMKSLKKYQFSYIETLFMPVK